MLVLAGFLTGLVVGLTGVGGGALMTPLLLLVFGVAPQFAVGTDLWFAAVTKTVATRMHQSRGLVDWGIARRLWYGSIPSSVLVLIWLHASQNPMQMLPTSFLKVAVASAVLLTASGMLFQRQLHRIGERYRKTAADRFKRMQLPMTVVSGVLLGVLVTLTSVGAGAIGVVLLTYLYPLRLTPPRLIATDVVHAIPLAVIAGLGHLFLGHVDGELLLWLLIGSLPGVIIGASLSTKLPHHVLRLCLAAVLSAVGIKLMFSSL